MRAEHVLLFIVGAFGTFVGVEVLRTPAPPSRVATSIRGGSDNATSVALHGTAPARSRSDLSARVLQSGDPAPSRNVAEVRDRITSGAPGTYMLDMLAAEESLLVRWPDRRVSALRVWVQSESRLSGWSVEYPNAARSVFEEWLTAGLPLRFDFVFDSSGSDIQVTWIDHFPASDGRKIGSTRRTYDQSGWIVSANIVVAVHDSSGRTFTPDEVGGIVRHEVGHALGLGHSKDRTTIMYPRETVHDISGRDRATLRLLYTLPPGSVK